jgi:hypothetical protein
MKVREISQGYSPRSHSCFGAAGFLSYYADR